MIQEDLLRPEGLAALWHDAGQLVSVRSLGCSVSEIARHVIPHDAIGLPVVTAEGRVVALMREAGLADPKVVDRRSLLVAPIAYYQASAPTGTP